MIIFTKSNSPDIYELFKEYFNSVYTEDTLDLNNSKSWLADKVDLSNIQFSQLEIFLRLNGLSFNCLDKVLEIVLKSW